MATANLIKENPESRNSSPKNLLLLAVLKK